MGSSAMVSSSGKNCPKSRSHCMVPSCAGLNLRRFSAGADVMGTSMSHGPRVAQFVRPDPGLDVTLTVSGKVCRRMFSGRRPASDISLIFVLENSRALPISQVPTGGGGGGGGGMMIRKYSYMPCAIHRGPMSRARQRIRLQKDMLQYDGLLLNLLIMRTCSEIAKAPPHTHTHTALQVLTAVAASTKIWSAVSRRSCPNI